MISCLVCWFSAGPRDWIAIYVYLLKFYFLILAKNFLNELKYWQNECDMYIYTAV